MKPLELAFKYLEIFFSGENLDELKNLLAEDLSFTGPLFKFSSAEVYVKSLKEDPPKGMKYEIIKTFADDDSVCVIYNMSKGKFVTPMAQYFEMENSKIKKIILIFESKEFK